MWRLEQSCTLSQTTSSVTHRTQIWQNKEEEKNQQYTKYTSMMLCKQTLMCFEDSNVSQEERKEKVSKTGMGKGKREGGKCEMGREFSVLQDGCEV